MTNQHEAYRWLEESGFGTSRVEALGAGDERFLVTATGPAAADAETHVSRPPARWATDTAGFMSPQALQTVDRILESFERATGNQVLV